MLLYDTCTVPILTDAVAQPGGSPGDAGAIHRHLPRPLLPRLRGAYGGLYVCPRSVLRVLLVIIIVINSPQHD